MLGGLGSEVDPRRGGGRGKVAGHGEVVDVSPFDKPRARLLISVCATRGEGEGLLAELLVGLGALEEKGGHIAITTPDEGTIVVLGLHDHPFMQIEVAG